MTLLKRPVMSENDDVFYKKLKKLNWTFVIVQIVIFIFIIGVTYNRLLAVEQSENKLEVRVLSDEKEMMLKADKTDVDESRKERRIEMQEMKLDIKSDLREIRQL